MTDDEFYQLADEQINLLFNTLKNVINLNIKIDQSNTHQYSIELSFINLIEAHLTDKKIHEFESVKEYFCWLDRQIQITNRKIKADEFNYHLGQKSLSLFVFLYQELNKIYYGNEFLYKVGMANIQLMISSISEME